jgi:hypothetical protein
MMPPHGKITMFFGSATRMPLLGAKQALKGGKCHGRKCHGEQGSGRREAGRLKKQGVRGVSAVGLNVCVREFGVVRPM